MPIADHNNRRTCTNCRATCALDQLYCPQCGAIIVQALKADAVSYGTKRLDANLAHPASLHWGTGFFHSQSRLFLQLGHTDEHISVPIQSSPVVIGRKAGDFVPHVDLSEYCAVDLGVSRQHARIDLVRNSLQITDLYSANGTFLNHQRLQPRMPYNLQNNAVIQLGKLVLRVKYVQ